MRKKRKQSGREIISITADHFSAGLVLENDEIVQAAPIVYWMLTNRFNKKDIQNYCRRKKWKCEVVTDEQKTKNNNP